MLKGHCECNRVSYEADCEVSDFSHCHCSQCRRLHGAAYATFAKVKADKFRYLLGEEDIKKYASSDDLQRVFCGNCGSNILVSVNNYPEILYLSMGAIDGNPNHPDVLEAKRRTFTTAISKGVPPRAEINSADQAKEYLDMGVRHFSVGTDISILFNFWKREGELILRALKGE